MKATFRVVFLTMLIICAYSNDAIAQSTTNNTQPNNRQTINNSHQLTIGDVLNMQKDCSKPGERAIAMMDHLILTLQRIKADKSARSIMYEKDQLQNNCNRESYRDRFGLVYDCLGQISTNLTKYKHIAREKELLERSREVRDEGLIWDALNNSFRNVINTGGQQTAQSMAFITVLSLARAGLEYKHIVSQNKLADLKAYYQIANKTDIVDDALWSTVDKTIQDLYENHKELTNANQLTPQEAENFVSIINDPNKKDVIQKLVVSPSGRKFCKIIDYYYYVGMAYLDNNEYDKAKGYFLKYIYKYYKAPIFKTNEKICCIALAIISQEHSMPFSTKKRVFEKFVRDEYDTAINNAAWLNTALIYAYNNHKKEAFELLRDLILRNDDLNKEAAVMIALQLFGNTPEYYSELYAKSNSFKKMSIANRIAFVYYTKQKGIKDRIKEAFSLNDAVVKDWDPTWRSPWRGNYIFDKSFDISVLSKYDIYLDKISVYREDVVETSANKYERNVCEYNLSYKNTKSKDDILGDLKCLKDKDGIFNILFGKASDGNYYTRPDINVTNIGSIIPQGQGINNNNIKDISDYFKKESCKDENNHVVLKAKLMKENAKQKIIAVTDKNKKPLYVINQNYIGKDENPKYSVSKLDKNCRSCIRVVLEGQTRILLTYVIRMVEGNPKVILYSVQQENDAPYIVK